MALTYEQLQKAAIEAFDKVMEREKQQSSEWVTNMFKRWEQFDSLSEQEKEICRKQWREEERIRDEKHEEERKIKIAKEQEIIDARGKTEIIHELYRIIDYCDIDDYDEDSRGEHIFNIVENLLRSMGETPEPIYELRDSYYKKGE